MHGLKVALINDEYNYKKHYESPYHQNKSVNYHIWDITWKS